MKDLANVAGYLDEVIVFDPDSSAHVLIITGLSNQLRKQNLKLSPSKVKISATDADFLGHTISPAGIRPDPSKVAALTRMPMPSDLKQIRSLLGDLSYCRKFQARHDRKDLAYRLAPGRHRRKDLAHHLGPEARGEIRFYTGHGGHRTDAPRGTIGPAGLVYPDWDAVGDNSRPFLLYRDASIDGFGATLEQEQKDGSIGRIFFISRATLESERHWTPLDLEAGSIAGSINRLRGYLWGTTFRIVSDHKALESLAKVAEHKPRVQKWLELLTAYRYTLGVPQRQRQLQRLLSISVTVACFGG